MLKFKYSKYPRSNNWQPIRIGTKLPFWKSVWVSVLAIITCGLTAIIAAIVAVGMITVLSGCSPAPALLETPQQLSEHVTHPQTFYSISRYVDNDAVIVVLRDQAGKKVAELSFQNEAVFLTMPGEEPQRIRRPMAPLIEDEFMDVWAGNQKIFSFFPLLYDD